MKKCNRSILFSTMLLLAISLVGCGKETAATKPGKVAIMNNALQVSMENDKVFQEIDGFGGSFAFYDQKLYWSKKKAKDMVFKLLFEDAKMSIIRLKNQYGYTSDNGSAFNPVANKELIKRATAAMAKYNEKPTILMSSWSPAGYLKSNDITDGLESTLKKKNGKYVYNEYGAYWADLVKAYRQQGISPDYISIQNECDFDADYEGCLLAAQESKSEAAYSKAYLATYDALQKLDNPPKMLGPETMTANAQTLSYYMEDIYKANPQSVAGIAFHLYAGTGESYDMKGTDTALKQVNNAFLNQKKWQTEYGRGGIMDTCKLVQSGLYNGNLNAYLFWASVWRDSDDNRGALIATDFTFDKGYYVSENYYAMRHFSEFIRPGYHRIGTNVATDEKVSVSAYVNENQGKMAAVAINETNQPQTIQLQFSNYKLISGTAYISNTSKEYKPEDLYKKSTTAFNLKSQSITLPAKSIVTLDITGKSDIVTSKVVSQDSTVVVGESASINGVKGTPALSGEEEDIWAKAPMGRLQAVVNGDHGATAEFKTLYDDKYLYVKAMVHDATNSTESSEFQKNDYVDFFINENGKKSESYQTGDSHYSVSRDNKVKYNKGAKEDGFDSVTYEVDGGYVVEVAIPLRTITGKAGTSLGFDVGVNDSFESAGIEYVIKWCDGSAYTPMDLEKIGTLNLK